MKRKLIKIQKNKSAYFAGDFHLGKPDFKISHERELKLTNSISLSGKKVSYITKGNLNFKNLSAELGIFEIEK